MTRSIYRTVDGQKVWSTVVTVIDQDCYDSGDFNFGAAYEDGSLNAVIESLLAVREKIPAEYRDKARCEIDASGGYSDSYYAHIKITYERPETTNECKRRELEEDQRAAETDRKDRAAYEALKRRYG